MKHGTEWYKRDPAAYLGGVQGLTAKEHAVYAVILDLIYMHGGAVNNDPRWISGWISDMGAASVRGAIESLAQRGKLIVSETEIRQKRAESEVKTRENLRETRQKLGRIGGENSAKSRALAREINDIGEAKASRDVEATRLEKSREERTPLSPSGEMQGNLLPEEPPRPKRKAVFPEGWTPSEKQILAAIEKGMDRARVMKCAVACVDYHRSRGTVFLDHEAAFRTWLRNDLERFGASNSSPRHTPASVEDARFSEDSAFMRRIRNRSAQQ